MIVDPGQVANIYANESTQRVAPERTNVSPEQNPESLEPTGQTSDIGPAVVTNFSAAALETARATTAPEQPADRRPPNRTGCPNHGRLG